MAPATLLKLASLAYDMLNPSPTLAMMEALMTPENENQVGLAVSALRRRLNMTQEEFAHAIGVTVSTVNRWENGHIVPSRLARKAMESLAHDAQIPADLLGQNSAKNAA